MKYLLPIFSILFLVNYFPGFSQQLDLERMKNVIPPSPNASSLGKYGEWPVNLYTGLPSINIPIYTLEGRSLSIPVSLSYHAAGNKVGDIASFVGLGWSLNAGGIISRSIRGLPDDDPTNGYFVKSQLYTNGNNLCSTPVNNDNAKLHKAQSSTGEADSEQDLYSFNALGRSFNFFIKNNGVIVPTPWSNVKISTNFLSSGSQPESILWTTIFEDGTKLTFGGITSYEVTTNPKYNTAATYLATSWLLKSVISTTGEVITFSYSSTLIDQDSYFSESDGVAYKTGGVNANQSQCANYIDRPGTIRAEKQQVTQLQVNTIESDLVRIDFELGSSAREDLKGGKYLSAINVYSKSQNKYLFRYSLEYAYSIATSSVEYLGGIPTADLGYYRKRLKLLSLKRSDPAISDFQKWTFSYNPQLLPSRRSFAQDHWGFFNGAVNNLTLLPKYNYTFPPNYFTNSNAGFNAPNHVIGGNREGNGTYTKAEILESIIYPTGGRTTFYFDANAINISEEIFQDASPSLNLNLSATSNPFTTSQEQTFVVTKAQNVKLSLTSYISPGIFNDQPNAKISLLVTKVGVSSGYSLSSSTGISDFNRIDYFNITETGTYILKIIIIIPDASGFGNNDGVIATGSIQYQQSLGSQNISKPTGGLRLSKIIDFDNIDPTKNIEKSFLYELPLINAPVNIGGLYFTTTSERTCTIPGTEGFSVICDNAVITRNSSTKFSFGAVYGGPAGYGKVTAILGVNGVNGKQISEFSNDQDLGLVESQTYPFPATDPRDWRRGLLLKQTDLNAQGVTLKTFENTYNFIVKEAITSFKVGPTMKFNSPCGAEGIGYGCTSIYKECTNLQQICYNTTSEEVQITSSIERMVDPGGTNSISTTTTNFYANSSYASKTKSQYINSKGEVISTEYKYPFNFPGVPVYDAMVSRNIISPVIEQKMYKNGTTLLSQVKTTYGLFNSSTMTLPILVESATMTNPLTTDFTIDAYDIRGKQLQTTGRNGIRNSYIWGYLSQYPIAQVTNARYNEIFTESFEEAGTWNSITALDPAKVHAGKFSARIDNPGPGEYFCSSTKTLNISLTSATKFKYSGWVYSNGPTVELIVLMKRAGETQYYSYIDGTSTSVTGTWIFLEKEFTVQADVTQLNLRIDNNSAGTVWYDDIRLCPSIAEMTTYTYNPLVGLTSQTDINNRGTYYEYDALNRLSIIRDQDRNVLKKFCYNYFGQAETCVSTP